MSVFTRLPRRFPLFCFFVLTYAASAAALIVIGPPRLDATAGRSTVSLVMFPVIVIAVGLAGLAMTAATDGRPGLRRLRARLTVWRLGAWWLVMLVPPLAILSVLTVLRVFVSPDFAPGFLILGAIAGLISGFFEELGWTGFAYPRLSTRFGPLTGALLLGVLWAAWHFPVVDSLGAASPHGAAWPAFFASFAAMLVALRVLIAWLYTNTGSLLAAQLLHASSTGALVVLGAANATPGGEALWYLAYAAVLWVAVAAVVVTCGTRLMRPRPHHLRGESAPADSAAAA